MLYVKNKQGLLVPSIEKDAVPANLAVDLLYRDFSSATRPAKEVLPRSEFFDNIKVFS